MKKVTIKDHTWDALYFKKGYYFIVTKEELKQFDYDKETHTFTVDSKEYTWDCEVIEAFNRVEHILKHMIEFNIHRFETYEDTLVSIRLYEKSA
jgi:glucosamine 6-phosphate synthetase-like amidotransferase/phosphosugar isomerase protein